MKRIVGAILILISSILYCCPYVCTAIYLQNFDAEFSAEVFRQGMQYIGGHFQVLSIIFLIAGVVYLAWGELKDK